MRIHHQDRTVAWENRLTIPNVPEAVYPIPNAAITIDVPNACTKTCVHTPPQRNRIRTAPAGYTISHATPIRVPCAFKSLLAKLRSLPPCDPCTTVCVAGSPTKGFCITTVASLRFSV